MSYGASLSDTYRQPRRLFREGFARGPQRMTFRGCCRPISAVINTDPAKNGNWAALLYEECF